MPTLSQYNSVCHLQMRLQAGVSSACSRRLHRGAAAPPRHAAPHVHPPTRATTSSLLTGTSLPDCFRPFYLLHLLFSLPASCRFFLRPLSCSTAPCPRARPQCPLPPFIPSCRQPAPDSTDYCLQWGSPPSPTLARIPRMSPSCPPGGSHSGIPGQPIPIPACPCSLACPPVLLCHLYSDRRPALAD
jgi:hypothetical protein